MVQSDPAPNVQQNPLPRHEGAGINMITMDEEDGDPTRFIVSECEADGMIDRRQACMRARFLGHFS